jgi:predicted amidophosphoribosyltransferase
MLLLFGSLLDERVPVLPPNTVVVPVPTVHTHVRRRGYDHSLLIAREFARRRNLVIQTHVSRVTSVQQRGRTKAERFAQAKEVFVCTRALAGDVPFLLVDDVVITNATVRYAASALRYAGAQSVCVAAIARQPMSK